MRLIQECYLGVAFAIAVNGIPLEITSAASLENAAKTIAKNMMSLYTGDEPGGTPGLFPYPPYFCEYSAGLLLKTSTCYSERTLSIANRRVFGV